MSFFRWFLVPKKVIWKNHHSVAPVIDCFEPIFGFLRSFWFEKYRSASWSRIGMFSELSGHSVSLSFFGSSMFDQGSTVITLNPITLSNRAFGLARPAGHLWALPSHCNLTVLTNSEEPSFLWKAGSTTTRSLWMHWHGSCHCTDCMGCN